MGILKGIFLVVIVFSILTFVLLYGFFMIFKRVIKYLMSLYDEVNEDKKNKIV